MRGTLIERRGIFTKKIKLMPLAISSALMITLCFITSLRIYTYNENESFMYMLVTLLLIFLVISQVIRMKQNIYKYFNRIERRLDQVKCYCLYNSPEPIAITDKTGKILWYNNAFYDNISNETDAYGMSICESLLIDQNCLEDQKEFTVECAERQYRVKCVESRDYRIDFEILFFRDDTDYLSLCREYNDKKPTVALIVIDNYEEVFQNTKESERSKVLSNLEQALENFTSGQNSLIQRCSKDRFMIVFEDKHLRKVISERFSILDEIRKAGAGTGIMLTISIGVGAGGSSLAESETFAKETLDMALGRGGDQAAVKTENGYEFFGGLSKPVEKQSKLKTRLKSIAIQKLLDDASTIFIMGHMNGDLDALGASIGLSCAISILGRTSYIVINEKTHLAPELIQRAREQIQDIAFITESEALEMVEPDSLLIIVDTHKKALLESKVLYEKVKNTAIIDHHRKDVNYIDNSLLFFHDPNASSASEMVTEIIPYFKNFTRLPEEAANALLAGIMLDTKNFVIRATVRTFEAAAYLKKMGADTVSVKEFFTNSIDFYRMKAAIVSSAELYKGFAVSVVETTPELEKSMRVIASQAADELMNISDICASFVIFDADGKMNISGRSYGKVNVQLIVEKLHYGGGHQTMAAAQIPDITAEKAKEMLLDAIEQYLLENMTDTKTLPQKEN